MNQLHEILTRKGHSSPVDTIAAVSQSQIVELANRLTSTSVDEVRTFVDSHPEGEEILRAVALGDWDREQARLRQPAPSIVVSAVRRFEVLNRGDLARTPAEMIVLNPDARLWALRQAKADLTHLSQLVRIGHGLGPDCHEPLLNEVARAEWLDAQFTNLKPGKISSALLSLANYLDEDLWPLIHRASLCRRVKAELTAHGRWGGHDGLRAFSLLGASAAIGSRIPIASDRKWPDDRVVGHMVDLRASHSPADSLGTYELQLWLGLREMSRQRTVGIKLPLASRDGFLRRLSGSRPPTKQAQAIRDSLIVWVETSVEPPVGPSAP